MGSVTTSRTHLKMLEYQIELALLAMFTIKFRPVYLGIAKSELDHFRRNIHLYE